MWIYSHHNVFIGFCRTESYNNLILEQKELIVLSFLSFVIHPAVWVGLSNCQKTHLTSKNPKQQNLHETERLQLLNSLKLTEVKCRTLNGLQLVCEACSYLESPFQLPFDPVKNEKIHPTVEVGEKKGKTAQKVIIAKEMNFKTQRRTLLKDLHTLGGEEKKNIISGAQFN